MREEPKIVRRISQTQVLDIQNSDLKLIIRDLLLALEKISRGAPAEQTAKEAYAKALAKYQEKVNRSK